MKVIIMRGIPGAGKSFVTSQYTNAVTCSADHYFMDEQGNYNFNSQFISDAHASCMKKFLACTFMCRLGYRTKDITVDNTNIELWEISPYIAICQAYNIGYETITIKCDPDVAIKRNVHDVPARTIKRMAERLEHVKLLPWWNNKTINN